MWHIEVKFHDTRFNEVIFGYRDSYKPMKLSIPFTSNAILDRKFFDEMIREANKWINSTKDKYNLPNILSDNIDNLDDIIKQQIKADNRARYHG